MATLRETRETINDTMDDMCRIYDFAEDAHILLGDLSYRLALDFDTQEITETQKTKYQVNYRSILRVYDMLSNHLIDIINTARRAVE